MSAFYSFVYPDRVHILTDAGFFDKDGVLQAVGSKILSSSSHPLAMTGRGTPASEVFVTLDEMIKQIESLTACYSIDAVLSACRVFFAALKDIRGPFEAEYLIAAYSETKGPCHFFVQCHGRWEVPSFELLELGSQIGGGPQITFADLDHLNLSADEVVACDFPERYGVDVMQAMRLKPGTIPGTDRAFFGVGGHCDITTVTSSGVTTRTLCTWPDEIGFPINPLLASERPSNGERRAG